MSKFFFAASIAMMFYYVLGPKEVLHVVVWGVLSILWAICLVEERLTKLIGSIK